MKTIMLLGVLLAGVAGQCSVPETQNGPVDLLVVVGAPGQPEFGEEFAQAAKDWVEACDTARKTAQVIRPENAGTNELQVLSEALAAQKGVERDLWLVLIGHGTFDGREAKFNLAGPDISAKDLAEKLGEIKRPVILVNTSSSSAPFMNALAAPGRFIVTATKSGWEENYARFGKFFAKCIVDRAADIDQDGQVSLLEAFLMASRQVEDFYKSERRLATEHALIDDNGDGKGTPASFFEGVRAAKESEDGTKVDGFRAHQIYFLPSEEEASLSPETRQRRNNLEAELEQLRAKKDKMPDAEYMKALERIALDLSRLYRDAAAVSPPASSK